MTIYNAIDEANLFMLRDLSRLYLSPKRVKRLTTIQGACITTDSIRSRTSVPADAITLSHLVEHPELGFSFRFRVVWREEALFRPAVHVAIEKEWDDAGLGSPAAVSAAINDWLQAATP